MDKFYGISSKFIKYERASLARAAQVAIHFYLYSDLSIIFGINVPVYPSRTVETTFLAQFLICLLFSRKQQQIFIICC